jgi:SP family myo-inositol transporter-like MFS transporter 13
MGITDKTMVEEKQSSRSSDDVQQLEDAGRRLSTAEEVTRLSGIEDTAASKAAWLISITVSLGGFLFG